MTATLTANVLEDEIAVSLARGIATANQRARELGIDIAQSLITIRQQPNNGTGLWRINYGPKDYINRRGGDLIIDVNPSSGSVEQVLWGQ